MNIKHIALASVAALGMIAIPAKATAQIDSKMIETIAAIFLADKLGIDSNSILATAVGSNASVFDMAPAFQMQRYAPATSRTSAQSIYQMRQSGMGWGEIAKRLNMQPGEFNKLRNSGALDTNTFWRNTTQNRFSLNQSQVNRLREMGFNWKEITNITVIARESGVSIFDVANRYRRYGNFDTVARGYNVTNSRVAQRVNTWRTSKSMPTQWRTVVVKPGTGWRTSTLEKSDRRAQPLKRSVSHSTIKTHVVTGHAVHGKATVHGKSADHSVHGKAAGHAKVKEHGKSNGKGGGHGKGHGNH